MLNTAATIIDPEALRARITGSVVTPADADWDTARQAWNLAADQRPAAVAIPRCAEDVVEVVRYAAARGLQVAPQGTGHNATAHASLSGTILLRTHELRGVEIDAQARVARAQAGDLWIDVAEPASAFGLAPISGSSPDVGVVGFVTGGGIGWLSRKLGLSADSVLAFEVVLADGRVARVDAEHEPELFWALRGGTGSYAVITAVELRLYETGDLYMGAMLFGWERSAEVLHTWRGLCETWPEEITTSARILQLPPLPDIPEPLRGGRFVVIDGAVMDMDEAEAAALLAPLRALGPRIDLWGMQAPVGLSRVHMDPEDPVPAISDTLMLDDVDERAIDELVAVAGPGSGSPLLMVELRHLGGALARRREGAGALGRLDAGFLYFAGGIPMDADVVAAIEGQFGRVRGALGRLANDRHYPNFQERARDSRLAYDPGVHARLQGVKAAYDPGDLVLANHPVRPA
ncbi:MAG TPA: FAD-binding protein [Baekduia sp.]|nr:FAD-binding protein [Baekduia sp.]